MTKKLKNYLKISSCFGSTFFNNYCMNYLDAAIMCDEYANIAYKHIKSAPSSTIKKEDLDEKMKKLDNIRVKEKKGEIDSLNILNGKHLQLSNMYCYSTLYKNLYSYISENINEKIVILTLLENIYEFLESKFHNKNQFIVDKDYYNSLFETKYAKHFLKLGENYIYNNFDEVKNMSYFSRYNFKDIDKNDLYLTDMAKELIINSKIKGANIYDFVYYASKYKDILTSEIFFHDFMLINKKNFKEYIGKKNNDFINDKILNSIYEIIVNHFKINNNNYFNFDVNRGGIIETYDLFFQAGKHSYIPLFKNKKSLISVNIHKSNMQYRSLFENCENLTSVIFSDGCICWQSLEEMFLNCKKLKYVDFKNLEMIHISSFESMFKNCSNLKVVDFSNVGLSKDARFKLKMDRMFFKCENLSSIYNGIKFNMNEADSLIETFYKCEKLDIIYDVQKLQIATMCNEYFKFIQKSGDVDIYKKMYQIPLMKIYGFNEKKIDDVFKGTKNEEVLNKIYGINIMKI